MLSISNLHFSIGETRILNGVSLEVSPGEKLGIIGPNGSGKTTLFNCICGFNDPTSGRIDFLGHNITHLAPAKRAAMGLGRVFQNFGIFREMTVQENIVVALESKQGLVVFPWSKKHRENQDRAIEHLRGVGLESKAKDLAGSLSGGQMRLLEIARLVAFGASMVLLDEPTAGVSPKMKGSIEQALNMLHETDTTVLIIEHDINFIQKICERIVVLDVGEVVLDGTPENVRNNTRLQQIYFGSGHEEEEGSSTSSIGASE
jgi:branched-chain amino acid transport system ATP-binding protein